MMPSTLAKAKTSLVEFIFLFFLYTSQDLFTLLPSMTGPLYPASFEPPSLLFLATLELKLTIWLTSFLFVDLIFSIESSNLLIAWMLFSWIVRDEHAFILFIYLLHVL